MADNRFRNFGCIVYPDSAPEDWKALIGEMCIPCFISPLHDKDIDPGDQPKKPHHHVVFMFDGKKSPDTVAEMFQTFGGVGCEKVQAFRGYARYLCHLDNPEKAQYNVDDVTAYGGADYRHVIGLPTDRYTAISEIIDFIDDNCITSLAKLMRKCKDEKREWFNVIVDNTIVVREYIKSNYWELKNGEDRELNREEYDE